MHRPSLSEEMWNLAAARGNGLFGKGCWLLTVGRDWRLLANPNDWAVRSFGDCRPVPPLCALAVRKGAIVGWVTTRGWVGVAGLDEELMWLLRAELNAVADEQAVSP